MVSKEASQYINLDGDKKTHCFTTFPNDRKKHIDYVIVYKEFTEEELQKKKKMRVQKIRELFFEKLKKESFDIHNLKYLNAKNETVVYALLSCSTERLLEEIAQLNYEMKLKRCELDSLEKDDEKKMSFFEKLKKKTKDLQHELDKENYQAKLKEGTVLSTVFDPTIKHMYVGINDEKHFPMGPLSNNTRMILVENMLNNVTFLNNSEILKQKTEEKIKEIIMKNKYDMTNGNREEPTPILAKSANFQAVDQDDKLQACKGLMFMIDEKYFDDAFVIHDESVKEIKFLNGLIDYVNENDSESSEKVNKIVVDGIECQGREHLKSNWASMKKVFHFQPLWEMKDYLGEEKTFYFAWLGTFITALWLLAIFGIVVTCIGLYIGIDTSNKSGTTSESNKAQYYYNIFLYSFDNDYMPYFAGLLCLWGCFFTEYWTRKESHLAFDWDVENFNNIETDLPEYFRKHNARKNAWSCTKKLYLYEKNIKKVFSYIVLLIMVGLVCLSIAAAVVFRVWIKTKVYPNDNTLKILIGDIGSILLAGLFKGILNQIYRQIAQISTHWENHRTKTEFHSNLILKLFIFNFVNDYGSLIYLAYFRSIRYDKGYFDLGTEYHDHCENDYCTPLLTTALIIALIGRQMGGLCLRIILPSILYKLNLRKITKSIHSTYPKKNTETTEEIEKDSEKGTKQEEKSAKLGTDKLNSQNQNEKLLELYLRIQTEKGSAQDFVDEEFLDKISLYGYLVLFGNVFSLGPVIILFSFLIHIRISSKSLLTYHRRPVGHKAQNLGKWINICRFLNAAGILNLSFYTALNSNWSKSSSSILKDNDQYRYTFIVAFENSAFLLWLLIIFLIPPRSMSLQQKLRAEKDYVKSITTIAKQIETNSYRQDKFIINDKNDDLIEDDEDSEIDSDDESVKKNDTKIHPINE